ncbi:hypothetical protein ACYFX5_19925 [Bremerella sp. T1]|uniref:hypothetical protein n=1 Tax=Bremerella sp. TYQ1 TaxID=3119568 RepID=UPI001CC900A8|nr:hypothetical protein [Bremerella volcania]UBM35313.1 hypothetical protein LA756_21875 [Bremerella volcania]
MDEEFLDISLSAREAFDENLLVAPSARKFGSEDGGDLPLEDIRFRIHRRPVAYNFRSLLAKSSKTIPDNFGVFDAYDIWLIEHTFSVVKMGGYKHVEQVGIHVSLPTSPRFTVLNVLPKSEFVTHLKLGAGIEADIAVDGRLAVPESALNDLLEFEELTAGGRLTFSPEVSLVGRVSFSLISRTVQAVGGGDNESLWIFERPFGGTPMFGEQTVVQVVLSPRRRKTIKLKTSLFATVSLFGVMNTKLSSDTLELEAILK